MNWNKWQIDWKWWQLCSGFTAGFTGICISAISCKDIDFSDDADYVFSSYLQYDMSDAMPFIIVNLFEITFKDSPWFLPFSIHH